jgi:hypothetical protein
LVDVLAQKTQFGGNWDPAESRTGGATGSFGVTTLGSSVA